jgi:hypothetical protein
VAEASLVRTLADSAGRRPQQGTGPMAINRNLLFLLIGALLVGVGVLGYELYREKKEPEGIHIRLGPLKIDQK